MSRLAASILLATICLVAAEQKCSGQKFYTVMLTSDWKDSSVGYPGQKAMFSEIIGFAHPAGAGHLFDAEKPVSDAFKKAVKTGTVDELLLEIAHRFSAKEVSDFSQSPAYIFPSGMQMFLRLTVNAENPAVSFMTVMRPTGQYFASVTELNLCDTATGEWRDIDAITLSVQSLDQSSGLVKPLECGNGFLCNSGDVPAVAVASVLDQPCFGAHEYILKYTANWTRTDHPVDFPWNGKFSKFIAVSHSDSYSLFDINDYATSGLQTLAEDAAFSGLYDEMEHEKGMGSVKQYAVEGDRPKNKAGFTIYPLGPSYIKVTVDHEHPLISFAAKVVPSPDWFVGASSVDMCDRENGRWKSFIDASREPKLNILPFDAGSVGGDSFAPIRLEPLPKEDTEITVVKCGAAFCEGEGDVNPPIGYAYLYSAHTDPFADGTATQVPSRTCAAGSDGAECSA